MKTIHLSRGQQVLCGLCIILLLSSCKITDTIREKAGALFDKARESAESASPFHPGESTQDASTTGGSSPDNDTLETRPTEVKAQNGEPPWHPKLTPIITETITPGQAQQVVADDLTVDIPAGAFTFTNEPADTVAADESATGSNTGTEPNSGSSTSPTAEPIPTIDINNLPDLVISSIDEAVPFYFPEYHFVGIYDITFGDIHQLAEPFTMTLKYDPGWLIPNVPVAAQIGVALYDAVTARWIVLPTVIDEVNHTLTFSTDHLSVVAIYLHTQADSSCTTSHFVIGYNKANITNATGNMTYSNPLGSCKTTGHPDFINAVADYLETAYAGYTNASFPFPEQTIVVNVADLSGSLLWGTESQFDTLTNELVIGTDSWGYPEDLRQDCAHELFHYWQYNNLGTYKYMSNQWWMDATADYAADMVAYAGSSYGETNAMGQDIKANYLEGSLDSTSNMHSYSTAHYVDYLVAQSGGFPTFKDLWTATTKTSSALAGVKSAMKDNLYSTFDEVYRDFANYMLFDANSALPLGDTVWDSGAVNDKVVYNIKNGVQEATASVAANASILWGLRVNEASFMQIEWTNTLPGSVYLFTDNSGDERTGTRFWKQLYPTRKSLFPMTTEDTVYILLINGTDYPLSFDLRFGASPVEAYTLGVNYADGGSECAQNAAWGTPTAIMELNDGSVTIHYSSQADDYYWSENAEHTIVATGEGTYANGQLKGSMSSKDTIPVGSAENGSAITGTITSQVQFNLELSADMPFTWQPVSASGTTVVDLPSTKDKKGFSCTATIEGVSVYPAYYFPLLR